MTLLEKYLENPVRFTRIKRAFYTCLAVVAVTEAVAPRFFYNDDAHFAFEDWPALGSIDGFLSCVAIIVVSKLLGKHWLIRQDNYYES